MSPNRIHPRPRNRRGLPAIRCPCGCTNPQSFAADQAVIVFFHGGGWIMGDLDTHNGLCGAICEQTGLRVVAVHYRRAPETRFPGALDDCAQAIRWVASQPAELGPVDALVLAGDSAGGNMAAACALMPAFALPVLAFWCMYASFDMDAAGGSMHEFAAGYLLTAGLLSMFRTAYFSDAAARRSPAASPLLAADLSGAPAALIFANEFDPLRDQSRAFAARLAASGRPVRYREAKGHVHGSMCRRALAPSGQADLAGCIADLGSLMLEARQEQVRASNKPLPG